MKNLLVFASVMMIGAAAFGQQVPRVYQYSANLNTTVAKWGKASYKDDGVTEKIEGCYRVKGKVAVKGVFVFGCECEPGFGGPGFLLISTSADKYTYVTDDVGGWIWSAARLGNLLSSKAKVAEMGLGLEFVDGPDDCARYFFLEHAGFGKASSIESKSELDITSISGNVVGMVTPPSCSRVNGCAWCVEEEDCPFAIAFVPCAFEDPDAFEHEGVDGAYGTFSVKFNKSWSNLIKPIDPANIQAAYDVLTPKVFGKKAVAPVYDVSGFNIGDCYSTVDIYDFSPIIVGGGDPYP